MLIGFYFFGERCTLNALSKESPLRCLLGGCPPIGIDIALIDLLRDFGGAFLLVGSV